MPHNEETGRTSRPSLLSEHAQQGPAGEDQGILNKLDGRASPSGTTHARRKPGRMGGVAAAFAAVAVLGGGALAWAMQHEDDSYGVQVAAAPAAPVPAAVPAPVPAPVPDVSSGASGDAPVEQAAAVQTPPAQESGVSAATILDEVPGAAVAGTAAALAAGTTAMAARGSAGNDGKDELSALLDKSASAGADAAKAGDKTASTSAKSTAAKKAARAKAERIAKAKAARDKKTAIAAARKKPAAKTAPKVDSDVALLAALLAHSKASPEPRPGKSATGSKGCAAQATVDAAKCREQPCASSAKAKNECKSPAVAEISG